MHINKELIQASGSLEFKKLQSEFEKLQSEFLEIKNDNIRLIADNAEINSRLSAALDEKVRISRSVTDAQQSEDLASRYSQLKEQLQEKDRKIIELSRKVISN